MTSHFPSFPLIPYSAQCSIFGVVDYTQDIPPPDPGTDLHWIWLGLNIRAILAHPHLDSRNRTIKQICQVNYRILLMEFNDILFEWIGLDHELDSNLRYVALMKQNQHELIAGNNFRYNRKLRKLEKIEIMQSVNFFFQKYEIESMQYAKSFELK